MRKIASSRKLAPFVFVPLLLLAAVPALGESEGAIAVAELPAGASIATPDAAGLLHALGSAIPAASEPALPASPEPLVFPDHAGWPVSVLGGAAPPVCADLDPTSPGLETVVGTLSSGNNLYVFRQDGTPMPGWPISIGFFVAASPSIGDVDGDGEPEIVVGAWGSNEVWALHADGTPLPGWPIAVGGNVRSTAALADLDPSVDGLEIIVGVQDGTLQAWHGDGTPVPGWPVTAGNFIERCSPAVGDVDGDGDLEVFVGSWYDYQPGSTGGVYGFAHDGTPLSGWPTLTETHTSVIASPALADLDGDGDYEIIVGTYETDAKMHVWNHDGTEVAGWPFTIPRAPASGSHVSSSPAVGDLDGDGDLEIVDGSCGQCGTVYVWNADGTVAQGWPVLVNCVVDGSSPAVGDVDGDGTIEIAIGSGSGFTPFGCSVAESKAYLFHADGTTYSGWPVNLGTAAPPYPALADMDADGRVELLLAYNQTVYAWDAPGAWVDANILWPYYHLGIDHTGFLGRPSAAIDDPDGAAAAAVRGLLRVSPNPGIDRVRIEGDLSAGVSIFDAGGRLVRALAPGAAEWDGKDAAGRAVAPGIYLVRPAGGRDAVRWVRVE